MKHIFAMCFFSSWLWNRQPSHKLLWRPKVLLEGQRPENQFLNNFLIWHMKEFGHSIFFCFFDRGGGGLWRPKVLLEGQRPENQFLNNFLIRNMKAFGHSIVFCFFGLGLFTMLLCCYDAMLLNQINLN